MSDTQPHTTCFMHTYYPRYIDRRVSRYVYRQNLTRKSRVQTAYCVLSRSVAARERSVKGEMKRKKNIVKRGSIFVSAFCFFFCLFLFAFFCTFTSSFQVAVGSCYLRIESVYVLQKITVFKKLFWLFRLFSLCFFYT